MNKRKLKEKTKEKTKEISIKSKNKMSLSLYNVIVEHFVEP
jgi:hypothetical protein